HPQNARFEFSADDRPGARRRGPPQGNSERLRLFRHGFFAWRGDAESQVARPPEGHARGTAPALSLNGFAFWAQQVWSSSFSRLKPNKSISPFWLLFFALVGREMDIL